MNTSWKDGDNDFEKLMLLIKSFFDFQALNDEANLAGRYNPRPKDPFAVYALKPLSEESADADLADFNQKLLLAWQSVLSADERLIVLDPYHSAGYWSPHQPTSLEDLNNHFAPSGFYPDGDYCMCLAEAHGLGLLAHPWSLKLYVCGKSLVEAIEHNKPILVAADTADGGTGIT